MTFVRPVLGAPRAGYDVTAISDLMTAVESLESTVFIPDGITIVDGSVDFAAMVESFGAGATPDVEAAADLLIAYRPGDGFTYAVSPFTGTGSATYDPTSLADGAGVTTTVTCTGAALGNFSEGSFDNDLQGVTFTTWVSSANTVSARFQNETGAPVDLASGTIRVRTRQ